MTFVDFDNLEKICNVVKRNMLETIKTAQTGHLGACCSSNELMNVLYFSDILRIDFDDPKNPGRDYVLNRGHLGPLRYNIFSLIGWLEKGEMTQYRKFGSRLCGHEDMNITPGVDLTPSGSLGMLLSYSVGAAHHFNINNMDNRVFCFLGDGEEQEGNVSEAARHATNLQLKNLIAIIDKNTKQLSTSTINTDGHSSLSDIWRAYGWQVLDLKHGHDIQEIYSTYLQAIELSKTSPTCIVAHTIKGNGIEGAQENYSGYHVYHNSSEDDTINKIPIDATIQKLSGWLEGKDISVKKKSIMRDSPKPMASITEKIEIDPDPDTNSKNTSYNYLQEYMEKLSDVAAQKNIYFITADYPPRSFFYNGGKFKFNNFRYMNAGIREQHVLAMAHGIRSVDRDSPIIIIAGDPFAYRSADQLNMLAQSDDNLIIYAVQAGLSGAKNGPTHQSSGQPGMILTMPNVALYEPSSKMDWFYCINKAFNEKGVKYIRTHQAPTSFSYGQSSIGPYYAIDSLDAPADCTIISSGQIIEHAVEASKKLYSEKGLVGRVINVLELKNITGVSDHIEKDKPLFMFYNGHSQVLSYPVLRDMAYNGKTVSNIIERGFDIGKTGSQGDLLRHFELDKDGIYRCVSENMQ